jgi:hypothetical protein
LLIYTASIVASPPLSLYHAFAASTLLSFRSVTHDCQGTSLGIALLRPEIYVRNGVLKVFGVIEVPRGVMFARR